MLLTVLNKYICAQPIIFQSVKRNLATS